MSNSGDSVLAKVDRARALLMEARDAVDAKVVVDMARAAEVYAKRQKLSTEAIEYATSIKVEALALMGEMLETTPKNTGRPGPGRGKVGEKASSQSEPAFQPPTLAELGITKKESVTAQTMARVKADSPELFAAACSGKKAVSKVVAEVKKAAVHESLKATPSPDACTVQDLNKLVSEGQQFGCIYADPPWGYSNQATRASTDNHYSTMTIEEIAALPVGELALPQSHLWLWTTNAFLFECPKLFEAWGFEFKSSYVWVKPQIGIGNYLRNAHEFLLLAVRGGLTSAARDVRSWGEFPRTEHSAKPESIRKDVLEKCSPGPYLELFGRKPSFGWTVWGNQIAKGLFDADVRRIA